MDIFGTLLRRDKNTPGTIRNFSNQKLWVIEPTPDMATARVLPPGMQSPPEVNVIGFRPYEGEITTNGIKGNIAVMGCLVDVVNYNGKLGCIGTSIRSADGSFGIYAHEPHTVWGVPCQPMKPPIDVKVVKNGDAAIEYHKLLDECGLEADALVANKEWRQDPIIVEQLVNLTQALGSPLNLILRLAADHAEKEPPAMLPKGMHTVTHAELDERKGSGSKEIADLMRARRFIEQWLYDLNANDFLIWMTSQLLMELRDIGVDLPNSLFVGNFPMKSFNAQARAAGAEFLVLIESGIFDLLELLPWILFRQSSDAEKHRDFTAAIKDFCTLGQTPSSEAVDHPSLRGAGVESVKRLMYGLVTAAEEFLISHEIGHCVLGHLQNGKKNAFPLKDNKAAIEVISKSEWQEHQADIWAAEKLYLRSRHLHNSESAALLSHGGALFALGLGGLVESYRLKTGELKEIGHPRAGKRIYMVDRYFYLRCKGESNGELGDKMLHWINAAGKDILGSELDIPLYDASWNSLVEDVTASISEE